MAISSGGGTGLSSVTSDINVTPMADIMLVLLIIFMITTPLIQQGIQINMAKARNAQEAPEVLEQDSTNVTIDRGLNFYINKTQVSEDDLPEKLADSFAKAPDRPVFIRCDVGVPYKELVKVVDKARDAGAERIGLIVLRQSQQGGS